MRGRGRAGRGVAAGCLGLGLAAATGAEAPFAIQTLAPGGRVVQADLADLDGDRRGDLLCITLDGLPPHEERVIHVYYQTAEGGLPARPDWSAPVPAGAAAYDLADLDGRAGSELVLLRRDRLTLLSLAARTPAFRDLPLAAAPTAAIVADERGIDRLRMVRDGLGDAPRLLVPGLGWTAVLTPSGKSLGRLDVGARANFYLPKRPGPLVSESEFEMYFDHPRLSVGDVDGDGRGDIVSANRHELRVFVQGEDGRFPPRPSRSAALGRLTREDHVRNSGSVRVDGHDLDGDGRLDLLIATAVGSLFDTNTEVAVHLNRGIGWDLDAPDQTFRTKGGVTGNVVIDLDGDGRPELIEARIPTGVLEIVEVLVTRAIDTDLAIYRRGEDTPFEPSPWKRWKLGLAWSFDTFRTLGFVPTLEVDLNGDGVHDLLGSGDGSALEVNLGSRVTGWDVRHASQPLDTGGRIRFGRLDPDGLTDFVLYDPRRPGTPVRVGRNRGVLPSETPAPRR